MPNSEPARVTQADREAAADFLQARMPCKCSAGMDCLWHPTIRTGGADWSSLVQAFARHRIASTPPTSPGWQDYERGLEDAARAAEKAWPRAHTYASENADLYRAQDHVRDKIATAIRALKSPAAPECGR